MKSKRLAIIYILFFCFAVQGVFAVPLEELVGASFIRQLRTDETFITETQLKDPFPKLLPVHAGLRQFVAGAMGELNPNIMVETLFLYHKPEHARTAPDRWDDVQKTGIFNQLLALSTLTGIQYYSASRQSMRTFFESSTVIDSPKTKNPLPDPVYAVPPVSLSLYARQKDLTFGDNIYRYDYTVSGDAVFFMQENETSLTIALIPVIRKGNLRSVLAVFDCGDSILVYAVSMAKTVSVSSGIGERVSNSFSNRAQALLSWFFGRADSLFEK